MKLRQIVEQRRAELASSAPTTVSHACFALKSDAAVLDVTASDGDEWQFPWQQFTSAHHGRDGNQESSLLTFLTHVITVRGYHFATLREAIRESCLALLRVAPTKYARTTDNDPFITTLQVRSIEERES